ncbi:MAG: L,D-transpeptidase family protein [Alphaproteobacteria bacterium]|nr:L,D-transpeptidase family protein [Alphaproteobacteria bacterium]
MSKRVQRNFGVVSALALLLVVASLPAKATSETAEAERNARFDKKNGATTKVVVGNSNASAGPAVTLTEIVAGQNQLPMLAPNSENGLKAAQDKYASIIAQGGFPIVPNGSYKNGSKGAGVGALNKHLYMEGYLRVEGTQGQFAQLYTNATEEAVSHFQRNMGLAVTGKVDSATLAELNVSAEKRMQTITANIPRLEIYQQNLGDRYLIVNIPAQQLESVSNGRVYSRHNVIVGRQERPTPVVMTPLETVKFNPYWNAPVSIVERDILPKMASGTQVLRDMNMKVFKGDANGPEVDPNSVRFTPANIDQYLFRQEPGPSSAMATAKIEFKSTFGIYLHDTPEPELFNSNNRFFSSGCIRVQKVAILLDWILNGQDGFNSAKIASMAKSLERLDVQLVNPPQLRVAYLTAWPTAGGTIAFRKDVYQLDGTGFTVGQPMPLGEMSPDGQRYVLKPLPRLVASVDDSGSSNLFSLFKSKSVNSAVSPAPAKNLFGSSLASTSSVQKSIIQKPDNSKKSVGLFDWASYNKDKSAAKHGVNKVKKIAKASGPSAIPPEPVMASDPVPPEPTLGMQKKKKKKIVAAADQPPLKPQN